MLTWRHNLFKSGKCSDDLLRPTCDSLVKHFEQANSQSGIFSVSDCWAIHPFFNW